MLYYILSKHNKKGIICNFVMNPDITQPRAHPRKHIVRHSDVTGHSLQVTSDIVPPIICTPMTISCVRSASKDGPYPHWH